MSVRSRLYIYNILAHVFKWQKFPLEIPSNGNHTRVLIVSFVNSTKKNSRDESHFSFSVTNMRWTRSGNYFSTWQTFFIWFSFYTSSFPNRSVVNDNVEKQKFVSKLFSTYAQNYMK